MMWTATRPRLNWSSVASIRAATVGNTKPGRWAIRKLSLSVWAAAYDATCRPSGVAEE